MLQMKYRVINVTYEINILELLHLALILGTYLIYILYANFLITLLSFLIFSHYV